MKHGRRHKTLKEQVYAARFRQGAQGYAAGYEPIPVAEPTSTPAPPPPAATPLAAKLTKKERKRLQHLGIDPDADEPDGADD